MPGHTASPREASSKRQVCPRQKAEPPPLVTDLGVSRFVLGQLFANLAAPAKDGTSPDSTGPARGPGWHFFQPLRWARLTLWTPLFLPGEFQGQRSLVGGHLWGRTELDATEAT